MRIGCLQFAPVKGDMDHNLSRADAVLCKANPDGLDLLVLPELAFTGYGFNSVDEIYPYSEPTCAGVTALWARTAALKFECTVVAGYAERVSSRSVSPRAPEHYNSAIIVNADGETIANYRKCYLQASDENWACEGQDGFYENLVMGIGQIAMGLSMDINPYRFEEPWENFDFAFHIMDIEANVVIITMSWPTNEDKRAFTRLPTEPDTNTLMFWISRLEPLIRAEKEDEVIVIFCNRCGIDGDTCFSGTSTVLGIVEGEVRVYGLLGRGVKELLVVDTYNPPFGRLVYRPDGDTVKERAAQVQAFMPGSYHVVKQGANVVSVPADSLRVLDSLNVDSSTFRRMHHSMETLSIHTGSDNGTSSKSHAKIHTPVSKKPPIPLSVKTSGRAIKQLSAVTPSFPTPSAPSPTPMGMRPRLTVPPVDSLTYRYIESQGHGMVLTPHPEIPQSPKIIDGRVNINFGSTIGSAVKHSTPPTFQTWPDLHPISIPAFYRPGSSKSDATLFSDWVESDYNSQYSVENNNRVMSGTNAFPRECERDRDNFSTIARLNARVRSNSGTGSSGRGFNNPDTPISPVEQTSTKFCREKSNSRANLGSQIERSTSAATEDFYRVSKPPMVELPSPLITRTGKTPQPFAAIRPIAASNLWMGDYRYEKMNGYYSSSPSGLRQTRPRHERGNSLVKRVSISKITKDGSSRSSSQVNESRGRRSTRVSGQKLTTGGSRDRKRSGSRKLDLSQFRMIEEYQSPNCPVHGRAARQRASSENRGEFDRKRAKSRSYSTGVINGPPPLPDTRPTNRENNKVGVIDHLKSHSKLLILPPLKTGNIPELTNESLEKHTTPVKPWVEVWMPPLSRSVPPSSLGQQPVVPAKAKVQSPKPVTSPRPEAGRVTPRAMVLINVDSAGASGPGSEPTYKCMDRPTIVDSVAAN